MNIDSALGGLKARVAKGYGLCRFAQAKAKTVEDMMLQCWLTMPKATVETMAWEYATKHNLYYPLDSSSIGVYSVIVPMEKAGYTNKKGVVKPPTVEMVHRTKAVKGTYLGTVKMYGEKPVSFTIKFSISKQNFTFQFNKNAETVADMFQPKEGALEKEGELYYDAPKKTYKNERQAVRESMKEERKAMANELDEAYMKDKAKREAIERARAKAKARMEEEELDEEEDEE